MDNRPEPLLKSARFRIKLPQKELVSTKMVILQISSQMDRGYPPHLGDVAFPSLSVRFL